ncbi:MULTISPECIES: ABC transporter permease [Paraburkholderia]|uniref:ABC transporter permease subunit n=1 Tax=Paraburkholderia madseniana TaxID=2599607 RepID=A0A6N6WDU7_9BURK|nr:MULTISPECIES: ABC transporter permease [Paraburkholderia]KAE8758068.1 ABC transporter permease subunit [Paraburkholderia madseniana]MCX4169946.1 ABC transporter permease [Paraburkholderia madseniana]MDQ6457958.1 ABC transporter permease [Paraburkholderia madseniana]NPT64683.1 ABC transporter permease subunit [Paraburkholderia madseniana]
MAFFLFRRVLSTAPVLVIVALIVFMILRLTPGDPAAALVGDNGTSADIARIHASLGLDRPLPVQFVKWTGQLLQGNLGDSYYMKQPITRLIAQRIAPTVSLSALTLVMTLLLAVPLGVIAASRHGGWLDRMLMGLSVMGFSVPSFVVGYILIWAVALHAKLLPVQGYAPLSAGIGPWLTHLILPAITLSIVYLALIARVTRAAVAEALTEDYIRTARAKGISEARVLIRHALANAAVPIVTVIGIGVGLLIGGVVVTETVYAIPGLGQLTVDAVLARDFPLVQGITLFFSFVYVLINLLVDMSYLLLDPRIRY